MGSGLAQIFGQIVSIRIKTLNNAYLVASSHNINEKASLVLTSGWRVSLKDAFA